MGDWCQSLLDISRLFFFKWQASSNKIYAYTFRRDILEHCQALQNCRQKCKKSFCRGKNAHISVAEWLKILRLKKRPSRDVPKKTTAISSGKDRKRPRQLDSPHKINPLRRKTPFPLMWHSTNSLSFPHIPWGGPPSFYPRDQIPRKGHSFFSGLFLCHFSKMREVEEGRGN